MCHRLSLGTRKSKKEQNREKKKSQENKYADKGNPFSNFVSVSSAFRVERDFGKGTRESTNE